MAGGGGGMSVRWKSLAQAAACAGAAAVISIIPTAIKAQGRGGAPGGVGPQLWTLFDANKDGSVTAAEIKTVFDSWYDAADTQKPGSVSQDQLSSALNAALGPPPAGPPAPAARGGGAGGRGAPTEFVAGAT